MENQQPNQEAPDHVLVVDDDAEIRTLLAEYLSQNGIRVTVARDATEMRQVFDEARPDIIILDLMMPGEDGLTVCRELRSRSNVPVIMLTARADEVDRIIGIEMGADDYLGKPFSPRELLARIKGVLRRTRTLPPSLGDAQQVRFAGWTLDSGARHLISPDNVIVPLSGAEYRLLSVLIQHPNRVLDRNQLMDLTLGREPPPSTAASTCRSAGCATASTMTPASRASSRPSATKATSWPPMSSAWADAVLPGVRATPSPAPGLRSLSGAHP